jgi:biopolymer transport protein ExbB/TolQ
MSLFGILSFVKNNGDYIAFSVIFLVVLFFFFKEFKITSKNSWGVLLGLTALGGFFAFKAYQRKKLLEQLEARERELEKIEQRYNDLKNKQQLSEAAYQKAKEDLERAKVDAALAILKADQEHAQRAVEIENEYQNISADDLIKKIKTIIQK